MDKTTTALPYAEALFQLSQNSGEKGSELVDGFVNQLVAISKNKEFQNLISNPDLQTNEVVDFILLLVKTLKNDKVRNFVSLLPEIGEQYYKLRSTVKSSAHATILSAFPLTQQQLDELMPAIEKRFGRKLNPTVTIDNSVICGIKVIVDDEVLDLTVSTKLQKMQEVLAS